MKEEIKYKIKDLEIDILKINQDIIDHFEIIICNIDLKTGYKLTYNNKSFIINYNKYSIANIYHNQKENVIKIGTNCVLSADIFNEINNIVKNITSTTYDKYYELNNIKKFKIKELSKNKHLLKEIEIDEKFNNLEVGDKYINNINVDSKIIIIKKNEKSVACEFQTTNYKDIQTLNKKEALRRLYNYKLDLNSRRKKKLKKLYI